MNLWQGEIVAQVEFIKQLVKHKNNLEIWSQAPLEHDVLFFTLHKISNELKNKTILFHDLVADLKTKSDITDDEIYLSIQSLIDFIEIDNLRLKLKREFQSEYPFELKRISLKENHFESWNPLGVLIHVTPNNSPLLGVFAMLEGLLSGNINVLKLARKDSLFAPLFFSHLCKLDQTGILKKYIFIGGISSRDQDAIINLFSVADVISAWGNEESIKSIKELAPNGTKIIAWGHKISFAYISKVETSNKNIIDKLAWEICNNEQMACSSPQCVFIEDASFNDLKSFSKQLSESLKVISPTIKQVEPGFAEKAELTITAEQVKLESVFGNAELIADANNAWRIYLDMNEGLSASPLFRTIWVRPLMKKNIVSVIRPYKKYLQTIGLAAGASEIEGLMQAFFQAGIQRIRTIGAMTDSYIGEPHDGIFALRSFCQKISFTDGLLLDQKASVQLYSKTNNRVSDSIMTKADFQNQKVDPAYSQLFFHSGGSSGAPKLSIFTYEDYNRQMEVAAEGLYAAGLDPRVDRCMNLFYAGSLYGGFISFFTILEKMEAIQFPMGASIDFDLVAETIVKNNVTTILGMPSYLMQLFTHSEKVLKKYSGIQKIFFGGEHFPETQRNYLIKNFKVNIIRSASYGSVDAGPLGYQCAFSIGGIHHLNERLHSLEVVDLFEDKVISNGEIGRFLFTSKVRHGQKIIRYEIGDVGRIVEGPCPCGKTGTRFELLGRHGDVFRIGTIFLSYQKIQKILIDKIGNAGAFQLHLFPGTANTKEKLLMLLEKSQDLVMLDKEIYQLIIDHYDDLCEVVIKDLVLDFEVQIKEISNLEHNPKTGKLRSVVDHRNNGG